MQLWTFQGIEIYDQMMREGITYCSKPTMGDNENFMYCYRWMAQQMRERIGEPPELLGYTPRKICVYGDRTAL